MGEAGWAAAYASNAAPQDAAWDALLAESGPLVNELNPMPLMDLKANIHAVERLRELVREGE